MIINNLSNEEYHNSEKYSEFWSSTQLKNYIDSPKRAYYKKFFTTNKSTPAMQWGTLIHDYLESRVKGTDFESKYEIFYPPINKSTGQAYGNTSKAYQEALSMCENPISEDEINKLKLIYNSLINSGQKRLIEHLIRVGVPEVSKFLEIDGIKLKIRPDIETNTKKGDWKSIRSDSFNLDGIQRQIQNMDYGFSAAMYQWVTHELEGVWKKFYWIFIESEPPYDFLIVDSAPYAFSIEKYDGINVVTPNCDALRFLKVLEQHKYCIKTEKFRGLDTLIEPDFKGQRIASIQPSSFYINKSIEYFNKK